MDPRYNWPPQAYANGQYPYAPPQQPNGYQQQHQQQGFAPQYPSMPMQMPLSQGHVQSQPYQSHPQVVIPQPSSQQPYQQMPLQKHAPQQSQRVQMSPQSQVHPRAQHQAVTSMSAPSSSTPLQMQPPKIRNVQVQIPVQRTSNAGIAQIDGAADRPRPYTTQQAPTPPTTKPVQRSQSHQENEPRPQQRTANTPVQYRSQDRAPLHPQSMPQPRTPSLSRTPSHSQTPTNQHRSPAVQQPSTQRKGHPQVVIPRSSSHQLTPTRHVQAPQKALPVDLSVMLLSAADEYIAAARGMGSIIIRDKKPADLRLYYNLMSTAMGCMDTVLKDFSLMPRDEAKLRLRYASLLIEETDNTTDIDELISKQISLCGRCRLQDLKYATFHLQARYQFKTNHRAGLKSLDKPISEAETFQHIAWVYAFRFLKVSLTLQIPGRVETVQTLQQLHAIMAHAEKRGDRAIYVACNVLETMVHLRSGASDRLEQAGRSIAAARSLQLQVSSKQLGSFGTLLDIIDVACGIQAGAPDNERSTKLIETVLDEKSPSTGSENGLFTVLIERSSGGNLTLDTGGVFQKSADLRDELVFAWLPREDIQTLCFHLSALDHNVHQKGMNYIKEAHARSRGALKRQSLYGLPLSVILAQREWNRVLDWHSMFTIGLMACFREDDAKAREALVILRKRSAKPPYDSQEPFTQTLAYLSAIIDQRDGSLESALTTYSSDELAFSNKGTTPSANLDIAILAAMNRLLIIRDRRHPQHHTASALLTQIRQIGENHPSQYMTMAVRLLTAIMSENDPINRQKSLLQAASTRGNQIQASTHNREFVIMALCCFTSRFFAGQVGDKPVQAAKAARQTTRNWRPLWTAVAAGLCMITFQRNGLVEEAQKAQMTFEAVRPKLPPALRGEEDVDAEGEEDADEMME